jgi:hypothetical protein
VSSKIRKSELAVVIEDAIGILQRSIPERVASEVAALTGPFATRLDDSAVPIVYAGEAQLGSSDSDHVWRIKKLDVTAGVEVTWAHGNANFDNTWDDRASYPYS